MNKTRRENKTIKTQYKSCHPLLSHGENCQWETVKEYELNNKMEKKNSERKWNK